MRFFVTGGAGFIGSNLVDRLLSAGHEVAAYDNLSTGNMRFLEKAGGCAGFSFIKGDALDAGLLADSMRGCDFVFHLSANADVRFGLQHPRRDLEQNTIATFNVLEAMRHNGIKRIAFASTGAVYGEPDVFPTPENCKFPVQTSLYGASKLACEGLVEAFCEGFAFQGCIFRFVALLGPRYTHGHVFDFYRKLRKNPGELEVLGDGHQRKSYLHVEDCVSAMLLAVENGLEKVGIYNIGNEEYCEVNDSVRWITQELGLNPGLKYAGGERGWIGDAPFVFLDTAKIRALGWKPRFTIQQSIVVTLHYLKDNHWLLENKTA